MTDIAAIARTAAAPQPTIHTASTPMELQAKHTAEEFESVFLAQMLGQMNLGIDPDSAFGGGKGEAAYQSMVAEQYGAAITEMGGIGIADAIYKEILSIQEAGK